MLSAVVLFKAQIWSRKKLEVEHPSYNNSRNWWSVRFCWETCHESPNEVFPVSLPPVSVSLPAVRKLQLVVSKDSYWQMWYVARSVQQMVNPTLAGGVFGLCVLSSSFLHRDWGKLVSVFSCEDFVVYRGGILRLNIHCCGCVIILFFFLLLLFFFLGGGFKERVSSDGDSIFVTIKEVICWRRMKEF